MEVAIAVLSTILIILIILIITLILMINKLTKNGWIRFGFDKPYINLINEFDNFCKEKIND